MMSYHFISAANLAGQRERERVVNGRFQLSPTAESRYFLLLKFFRIRCNTRAVSAFLESKKGWRVLCWLDTPMVAVYRRRVRFSMRYQSVGSLHKRVCSGLSIWPLHITAVYGAGKPRRSSSRPVGYITSTLLSTLA